MSSSTYLQDLTNGSRGVEITEDHFGANSVVTANFALEGGPYDSASQALGITHIRYPGGTVTEERIDPNSETWTQLLTSDDDYIALSDGQRVQTLKSMLEYAGDNNLQVTLVLPTAFLLSEGDTGFRVPDTNAINQMLTSLEDALREIPDAARIATIEVGNEYYYRNRMTADEYGMLADDIVVKLDAMLQRLENDLEDETGFQSPDIAVQAGAGWRRGDNETILELLSSDAKEAIDAVVMHYYPRTLEAVPNFDRAFGEMDDWRADPLLADVDFYVSEWNIQNTDVSDNGLLHAGSLVAAFEEMLLEGVDMASIWGTQYRSMDTRLSTLSTRDTGDARAQSIDTDLTAAGEVFRVMSSTLSGLRPLDVDTDSYLTEIRGTDGADASSNVLVTDFGDDSRYVSFISNRLTDRSVHLHLDLEDYFGTGAYVSLRIITAVDDPSTLTRDESDPSHAKVEPDVDFLYTGPIGDHPDSIEVPEGAIVILEVWLDPEGVLLEGQHPISDEIFIDYSDDISGSVGNDTILGHSGNDSLNGEDGYDIVLGGSGNDTVLGGQGEDVLRGDGGADRLFGGSQSDILLGGHGDDVLEGGQGSDLLIDGAGNDILRGGSEGDVLVSHEGQNTLMGGTGSDYFKIGGAQHTFIGDFNQEEGDRIDVSSHFDDADSLRSSLESLISDGNEARFVTLQLGEESNLTFEYTGQDLDKLMSSFLVGDQSDFLENSAAILNQMSLFQTATFSSGLDTESLNLFLGDGEAERWFEALSEKSAAGFVLGLDAEEIQDLALELGDEAVLGIVKGLDDTDLREFIATASRPQLEALLSDVPSDGMNAWYQELSGLLKQEIFDALQGTLLPKPDIDDIEDEEELPDDSGIDDGGDDDGDDPVLPVVPVPEDEVPADEDDNAEAETAGDCYIATVAYAGMDHPVVWMLRWYRDTILRRTWIGRRVVALYWLVGPILARRLSKEPISRAVARAALFSVAWLIARGFRRPMGRQEDHVPWPENRSLPFLIEKPTESRRVRLWKP